MTEEQYLQIAKEYAMEQGNYDIVTYIGTVGGLRVYNYTKQSIIGIKTGYPHYLEINNEGSVLEVWDTDKIMELRSVHIKSLQNV